MGENDEVEEVTVCGSIVVYTSIHLTLYSGWPNGSNKTQAYPIVSWVSLHSATSYLSRLQELALVLTNGRQRGGGV